MFQQIQNRINIIENSSEKNVTCVEQSRTKTIRCRLWDFFNPLAEIKAGKWKPVRYISSSYEAPMFVVSHLRYL